MRHYVATYNAILYIIKDYVSYTYESAFSCEVLNIPRLFKWLDPVQVNGTRARIQDRPCM